VKDVRWAKSAQDDLARIAHYYQAVDPTLPVGMIERIVKATHILAELPQAGQGTAKAGRRRWRVPRTDYVLFYRVERDQILVLRVLHGARQLAGRL
jgi:toxin ParE1/3/4